jgi:hypothetical protein
MVVYLQSLVPLETNSRGIETELEVTESAKPSTAIFARLAERFGADWIAIGSHGRSGLAKTLFGSVAHDVLARSRIPVLIADRLNPWPTSRKRSPDPGGGHFGCCEWLGAAGCACHCRHCS